MPSLTPDLERALEQALDLATRRGHDPATLEHLLVVLLSDPDARDLLRKANADARHIEARLTAVLDARPRLTPDAQGKGSQPDIAFQRVIQRAVLRVEHSGAGVVNGADIVASMLSERMSEVALILPEEKVTLDAALDYLLTQAGRRATQHGPDPSRLDRVEVLERELTLLGDRLERLEEQMRYLLGKKPG